MNRKLMEMLHPPSVHVEVRVHPTTKDPSRHPMMDAGGDMSGDSEPVSRSRKDSAEGEKRGMRKSMTRAEFDKLWGSLGD